jgi:hypothetical protein
MDDKGEKLEDLIYMLITTMNLINFIVILLSTHLCKKKMKTKRDTNMKQDVKCGTGMKFANNLGLNFFLEFFKKVS